jgi:hypothetical protein
MTYQEIDKLNYPVLLESDDYFVTFIQESIGILVKIKDTTKKHNVVVGEESDYNMCYFELKKDLTNEISKSESKLLSVDIQEDVAEYKFALFHHNDKTVLEQNLLLTKKQGVYEVYIPMISFEDFPNIDNPKQAINRYVEWMERMAVSLKMENKKGSFEKITI